MRKRWDDQNEEGIKNEYDKFKMMAYKFFFATLIFFLFASPVRRQPGAIKTGHYVGLGDFYIAYDSASNHISGYLDYEPYYGDKTAVQISCYLYFVGNMNYSDTAEVRIYYIGQDEIVMHGELKFGIKKITLTIHDDIPFACSSISFLEGNFETFDLKSEKLYKKFKAIKLGGWIYNKADSNYRTRKHLYIGNVVNVIKELKKWALIQYFGPTKITTGWVKRNFLIDF